MAGERSPEQAQQLIDGAGGYAIVMLDALGLITTWSSPARGLTGHDAETAVGASFGVLFTAQARDDGVPDAILHEARTTGSALNHGIRVRADGSQFWAHGMVTAQSDQRGEPTGFVMVMHDGTADHDQNLRLRELDVVKTELVASVSHELRTPLTSISGYTELLLDLGVDRFTVAETRMLNVIHRNSHRLLSLIDDLLILSTIDGPGLDLDRVDVPPAALVESARLVLRPIALAKGVRLTAHVPADLPGVSVDREQVERVLINVMSNAVKFTPEGGRVAVTGDRQDDGVLITVADTGIGIDDEALPRVFDRFYRSDEARERHISGSGLGLAVAEGIVTRHDGRIEVSSRPGQGTTVTIWLPAADAAGPEVPAP